MTSRLRRGFGTEIAYLFLMQPKEPRGEYANYFEVGYNAYEFVLNFGQAYEGEGEPPVHTRIVTNPACAKAMLKTMKTAVDQYEVNYGVVEEPSQERAR